jgi:hypothetical protein
LIGGAAENFHELIVFLVKTEKLPLSADKLQNDFNNERTRRKCIL